MQTGALSLSLISHDVELYTSRLLVQGSISGPFKRLSDLVNQREQDYLTVEDAAISALAQSANLKKLGMPVMIGRSHVHFVTVASEPQAPPGPDQPTGTGQSAPREFYVQKLVLPCYALTDTFVIFGHCYLLKGATLQNLLDLSNTFVPLTKATIYMVSQPNISWKRNVVIVNKEQLEVMYLADKAGG